MLRRFFAGVAAPFASAPMVPRYSSAVTYRGFDLPKSYLCDSYCGSARRALSTVWTVWTVRRRRDVAPAKRLSRPR